MSSLPRFTIEIDAQELGLILHGYDNWRVEISRQKRAAKTPERKAELQDVLDLMDIRYRELDQIADEHAVDRGDATAAPAP